MKRCSAFAAAVGLGVALACGPLTAPALSSAPVNSCPDHPCSAYVQAGATPVCNGGACLVTAQLPNLVLVVSLPDDSYFAPGRTFAIPFDHLFDPAPTQACTPPSCTHLPGYGIVEGDYLVQSRTAQELNWNVGNPGLSTSLPVHVTYRPLWQLPGASTAVDAVAAGLPLDLVDAAVYQDNAPNSPPGPAAGPSTAFVANMQPALYEATIAPDPPFDAAFPPDVRVMTVNEGRQVDADFRTYDTTHRTTGDQVIPTFDLTRADGLDGWTAYLRDFTTKRRISTQASLSGTTTMGVHLPTNHHPPDGDALTNAELVLTPPAARAIPTGKFPATPEPHGVLPAQLTYVPLPAPATVSGSITSSVDGSPVEADLVFEATGIYVTGSAVPNTSNFEYVGRATARLDAMGTSTYSVTLPRGQYNLAVRPLTTAAAVTIVQPFDVHGDPLIRPLTVDGPQQVEGSATVGDGRPLAGATVEAVPVQCFKGTSIFCRPRAAQTATLSDGSFMLMLDPGGYVLRVEPPDGTRLPWVVQSIVVGPTQVLVPTMVVPAPVYAGVQLVDVGDNPIVNAVVRVFAVQTQGGAGSGAGSGGGSGASGASGVAGAVEVARAITGSTGHYDVYLDPSAE